MWAFRRAEPGFGRERGARAPASSDGVTQSTPLTRREAVWHIAAPPTWTYDAIVATTDRRLTDSGIEVKPVYTEADLPPGEHELPGLFPFTRGPYETMYRGRPWTIRQYAGYGSAEETNARFRYLLERGQTGLSVAFDLPTQLGYDSDDALAEGEVGRTGVAIDSLDDMEVLLDGIPLGEVSTSMTINAPAALLLLLYELVAERQGVPGDQLRGTVQNDVLKEYVARGNYIFPPRPSMRLATDLFAYCAERLPGFNTISISGYHIREAGSSAAQELAFTLANGIAYCEAAVAAGLSPDDFGERLSFFFNAHNHFFQEVAKFRAARSLWAGIMRDRFGATNPRALALRFHAQTGGSTLTAQQPENNIVRVAIQALSAVCGGAQSLHTNSFDEALALPTERSATIALRTQQILAAEAGTTDTADPFGGSYFVEALTEELEKQARELIARIDELGGAVAAIEQGFVQAEIEASAFRHQSDVESGTRVVVGVNAFTDGGAERVELLHVDPEIERRQKERAARVRAERDADAAARALADVRDAAVTDANLLPVMREALRARCTIGEICGVLRELWGTYDAQHA
jgi:methylmalonyl-CoA mutase N-terminal domain/subunit